MNDRTILNRRFYPTRGEMRRDRIGPDAEGNRLLAMVNTIALEPQTFETVRIRKGVICNNQVDHYSTRFTDRALGQIVEMWPGVNNHVAHDSYTVKGMPVGIGLEAELRPIAGVDGGLEVFGAWYNSIGEPESDYVDAMVRKGIWRELSLAWWMESYTCDIDGKDVYGSGDDASDYYPGQELSDGRVVIGIMDEVRDLVEFSYVPRGGQIGTSIERNDPERIENMILAARGRVERKTAERRETPWSMWVQR